MLLVIALVLRLLDAILAFADPSDVDSIVFFFKAFLGAMLSSKECKFCILEKGMRGREVPPSVPNL